MLCLFIFNFWPHPVAYGILVPRSGMEPSLPAFGKQSLNHCTAREVPQLLNFNFGCDSFNSQCFIILFTLQSGCFLLNHFKTVGIQLTLEQRRFDCLVPFTSGFFFFFWSIQPQDPRLANYKFYLDFQPQRARGAPNPCVGQTSTTFKLSLVYRETTSTC